MFHQSQTKSLVEGNLGDWENKNVNIEKDNEYMYFVVWLFFSSNVRFLLTVVKFMNQCFSFGIGKNTRVRWKLSTFLARRKNRAAYVMIQRNVNGQVCWHQRDRALCLKPLGFENPESCIHGILFTVAMTTLIRPWPEPNINHAFYPQVAFHEMHIELSMMADHF